MSTSHENNMMQIRTATVLSSMAGFRKLSSQSNRTNRVKIEKGHAWLMRLLPFAFGASEQPWALIAQHWIGKSPVYCKQHTHEEFGGDSSFNCPVCEVADAMWATAEDAEDKDDFYKAQARLSFLMYALVFSKENDRGQREDCTEAEILRPYEFNIPKGAYDTLAGKIERSKARKGGSELGLLDMETGSDIWVSRDKKNSMLFDLSEEGPGPVFALDDQFEIKLGQVWKHMHQPTIKFLDLPRLNSIADKLQERAFDEAAREADTRNDRGDRGERNSRGRSAEHDEDAGVRGNGRSGRFTQQTEPDERPAARPAGRTAASSRSAAPVTPSRRFQQAQTALEDNSNPDLAPAAESQPEETAPVRRAAPVQQTRIARPAAAPAAEAPLQDPPQGEDPQGEPQGEEPQQQEEPPQEVRRAVGARPAPVRAAAAPVSAARRAAAPQSAVRPATGRPSGPVEDEHENLPEEQHDPAPPSREALPPRTATAAPAGQTRLIAALGPRIASLKAQQTQQR